MNQPRLRQFSSTEELRAVAVAWDDLWLRSEVSIPRARAHLVALWVDHFSSKATFRALAVEQDGRLVAALPLVSRWLKQMWLLQHLHDNSKRRLIDFYGPLDSWGEDWATRTYPVGRVIATTGRPLSQGLFHIYTNWQPRLQQFRQKLSVPMKSF